jgi:hypothetical protein
MAKYVVFLGAIVELLGILPYVRDTLNGTTRPNRVTWLLWGLAPLIAAAAAASDGVGWAVTPVFMAGLTPLTVFAASFVIQKAVWKLDAADYVYGVLSIMALVIWKITYRADLAILFSIASDSFATLPTLKKSWRHPKTETPSAYLTTLFCALTSFFSFQTWSFSECAFPIYLVITFTVLPGVIYYRRLRLRSLSGCRFCGHQV